MNPFVAIIWWVTLIGTLAAFVPNAVSWLIRALAAARHIERYSEEILAAGVGIAENTSKVTALKDTLSLAPQLVAGAEALERDAASIEAALAPGHGRGDHASQEGQP
jgi:hypothetical protein